MAGWTFPFWQVWMAMAPVSAAELSPSMPGLVRVVSRCTADPEAACWEQAEPLRRFAAAPGLHLPPVQAEVALAWSDEGLLVRARELPPGARVEVGLGLKSGEVLISRMEPLLLTEPGVGTLRPTRPLKAGEVRRAVVNVVVPDGDGSAALSWSPVGPATPGHTARLLFAEEPGVGLPVTFSTEGPQWTFEAIGGKEARIAHLRPPIPSFGRGVPEPWSRSGDGTVRTEASPEWGMHELVAVWKGPDGTAVDLQARRVWSEPPGPAGVDADALFFPPPRELALQGGDWALPEVPVLCADESLSAVQDLMFRELRRMTGVDGIPEGDCDLRLSLDPSLPAQGFRLTVGREGVALRAADRLGATAGALALVDALGPDARIPHLTVTDWPAMAVRPLYHAMNQPNRPDLTIDDYVRFIERVVARGRYSQLHLFFPSGQESPSQPELARRDAWSATEVGRLREVCEGLGIELVPGVNAPGHADWLLRARPELTEDVNASLLDVRHPQTRSILSAYYEDVWAAFGKPGSMHIGHDEALWRSHRWFGNEQNPRTATTPRALLFADDLRFHLEWCRERGIQPYLWTDMLLDGWNGARDGVSGALELLTDEERGQLIAMAWAPLGDPLASLTERWGIPVMRVHTGYLDWKRAGLVDTMDQLAGEGLALFVPAPWAAFAPGPGTRPLQYHLGVILLAGATAWSPDLEPAAHIAPTLAALAGHPALRPGFAAIPHRRARPLRSEGNRPDASLPLVAWSRQLYSDELVYEADPRVASTGAPVTFALSRPAAAAGVSVLVAAIPTHSAQAVLRRTINRSADPESQAVGWLVLEYADGSETRRPLEYGEDLYALESVPHANVQWRSADVVPMASQVVAALHPQGRDLRLYRVDLPTGSSPSPLVKVRVEAPREGIPLMVGAASVLLP